VGREALDGWHHGGVSCLPRPVSWPNLQAASTPEERLERAHDMAAGPGALDLYRNHSPDL